MTDYGSFFAGSDKVRLEMSKLASVTKQILQSKRSYVRWGDDQTLIDVEGLLSVETKTNHGKMEVQVVGEKNLNLTLRRLS